MKRGMAPAKTVDEYLKPFPPSVRNSLEQLRQTIKAAAPGSEEVISYMMPAYKQNGALVYFGGYKTHIGFYPTSGAIEAFKKELSAYERSKGTIRFPIDKPLPLGLVSKIVKFRVKENEAKKKAKK